MERLEVAKAFKDMLLNYLRADFKKEWSKEQIINEIKDSWSTYLEEIIRKGSVSS